MPGNNLVAAFWRPLRAEVERSGVSRRELGRRLGLSPSALSELLNGKRVNAPDFDVVREIVEACGGSVGYWRQRLSELEQELAGSRNGRSGEPAPTEAVVPGPAECVVCLDGRKGALHDGYEWHPGNERDPGCFRGAVRVLAGGDESLRAEAENLGQRDPRNHEDLDAVHGEFHDVVRRLMRGLARKVRRACHPHRLRLLHAAHTVTLIEGCVEGGILREAPPAGRLRDLALLLRTTPDDRDFIPHPLPITHALHADHRALVLAFYAQVAVLFGLKAERSAPAADASAGFYGLRLCELAADCPELFVWTGMYDGAARLALAECPHGETRQRLERLHDELRTRDRGLEGLETLLQRLARDRPPDEWPARLSEMYRHELNRPLSPFHDTGDGPPGPDLPRLSQGYVNPAFRVAVYGAGSTPHVDAWWNTQRLCEDIQGFLAGYLSGFSPADRPLVILGDPGAGKSLLTQLLAARLPPSDYLPIRIQLRNVPADAGILDQITQALRQTTLTEVTWDTVTASCDGVLPVLIFDGFDELLQTGGSDHWHYLKDIAAFQRRSAHNGRRVAAVVTSRTVVADQADFPDGSAVIRLEPFGGDRIARWTDVWNSANAGSGTPGLRGDLGARHPELAPQPILLWMLALYYAVDREAAADASHLTRVTLYERLLRLFVRRQIGKLHPGLRPEAMEERVEAELDQLSVIAAAMFNRGRQGVSAEEASHDLGFLRAPDLRPGQSEAPLLFGRFFFIHEARATYEGGGDRRWYEFLHATFGEYLVARKIACTLKHCPDRGPHDGILFALLSFAPLTERARILDDLGDLLADTTPVRALFPTALHALTPDCDTGYTTGRVPITHRHACYSANLLLLALAPGRIVHFSELTAGDPAPVGHWRSHTTLWKSQFTPTSWDAFTRAVGTVPVFGSGGPLPEDLALRLGQHDAAPTEPLPLWAPRDVGGTARPMDGAPHDALRRSRILYDDDVESLLEPSFPLFEQLENLAGTFVADRNGLRVSAAHALIALLLCAPAPGGSVLSHYERCLATLDAIHDEADRARFIGLISRRLVSESGDLPVAFVKQTLIGLTVPGIATRRLDDTARVALLACACDLFARVGYDGDLLVIMGRLLGGVPLFVLKDAALGTDQILTALVGSVERITRREPRTLALVWLLKLAVALGRRAWCEEHAARLLALLGEAAWSRLSPSEAARLHEAVADGTPALARRLAHGAGQLP